MAHQVPVEEGSLGVLAQLRVCCRLPVAVQIVTFGLFVGASLLLQGMNTYLITEAGFETIEVCGRPLAR